MTTQENVNSLTAPSQIEANRNGRITAAQKARLKEEPTLGVNLVLLAMVSVVLLVGLLFNMAFTSNFLPPPIAIKLIAVLSGIIGIVWFKHHWYKVRVQKDLANNVIKQAERELVFGWRGYAIQLPGRRVSIGRGRGSLLPGVPYRLYYLPHTGFILSAEALAPPDETTVKENLLKILAQANRFNRDSLEANRQGQLEIQQMFRRLPALLPGLLLFLVAGFEGFRVYQAQFAGYMEPNRQPALLEEGFIFAILMSIFLIPAGIWAVRKGIKAFKVKGQERLRFVWLLSGVGSFSVASYLVFRLYLQSADYPEPSMRPSPELASVIFVTIAALFLLLVGVLFMSRVVIEIWQRRVVSVKGMGLGQSVTETHTSTDEHGRTKTTKSTTYYYFINKKSFQVSKRAYNALIDGLTYRLYYLPSSRTLVNIEPTSVIPYSKK